MREVTSQEMLTATLQEHQMVVLYFTGSTCGACHIIQSKVEEMLRKYPDVMGIEVNGAEHPEIAARYGVFTLPIFMLFVLGKETVRESKHVDLLAFEEKIVRYYSFLK